ncbi:MAG: hypothetical protein HYU52_16865 [Acidobacteria bacterium]|nr:hypothetical protein [Acidobacteriota bacterium]
MSIQLVEASGLGAPLLWIQAAESDTEIAAFTSRAGGIRVVGPERADGELAALAHHPDRAAAVVVVESGVRGFEHVCERLSAMSPAPRVIVVYPKTRVLSSTRRLPQLARGL